MIPFAQPDLLHPANLSDYRAVQNCSQDATLDRSLSRAIFRLISGIENLFSKVGR